MKKWVPWVWLTAVTTVVTPEGMAAEPSPKDLVELEAAMVRCDKLKVSRVLYPGCTGPYSWTLDLDLNEKKTTRKIESPWSIVYQSETPLAFTREEIEKIKTDALHHLKNEIEQRRIAEEKEARLKASDEAEYRRRKEARPILIGGGAMAFIVIEVSVGDRTLKSNAQVWGDWKPFMDWIEELVEPTGPAGSIRPIRKKKAGNTEQE